MSELNRIDDYINTYKLFASVVGLWPYQLLKQKVILRLICYGTLTSLIVPAIIAAYRARNDTPVFVESIPSIFTGLGSYVCGMACMINMSKIKLLIDSMKNDWQLNLSESEYEILGKCAQRGKYLAIIFAIYCYITIITYTLIPLLPQVLDIILPLNGTRPKVYVFRCDYIFIENDNYYPYIYVHAIIVIFFTIASILSTDFSFLYSVQHACGMFQILGYRLENVDKSSKGNQLEITKDDEINKKLIDCIQLYNNILQFTDNIEHSFSSMFLIIIGINMLMISFQGLQIVLNLNNIPLLLRLVAFFTCQIIHLYFNTIPGQALIDESSKVSEYCYKCNWMSMKTNSQKLLLFMLLRASRECKVSAGKLYIISMENFSTVIKTSFSYLSVLTSAQ